MGDEDTGFEGAWDPIMVDEDTLKKLKNLAGAPVMSPGGYIYSKVGIDLRTGALQYPVAIKGVRGA